MRTANQIAAHRFDYCSKKCYTDSKESVVYIRTALVYVQKHLLTDGYDKVAKHLGVNTGSLIRQITKWRSQGKVIPYTKKLEVGTETQRIVNGKMRRFVKTESGWKCQGAQKEPKPPKERKPAKVKPVVGVRPTTWAVKAVPKTVAVFKTVVRNPELYRMERVDGRTWREARI